VEEKNSFLKMDLLLASVVVSVGMVDGGTMGWWVGGLGKLRKEERRKALLTLFLGSEGGGRDDVNARKLTSSFSKLILAIQVMQIRVNVLVWKCFLNINSRLYLSESLQKKEK
jgi:hypothetical protein